MHIFQGTSDINQAGTSTPLLCCDHEGIEEGLACKLVGLSQDVYPAFVRLSMDTLRVLRGAS